MCWVLSLNTMTWSSLFKELFESFLLGIGIWANIPVSLNTAKQMIKSNNKTERLNNWALSNKGRSMFAHMPTPNKKDPNNSLKREDQVIIFRLRTQHIPLNAHLNRIKTDHAPICPLCDHPQETVKHFLFECEPLDDLRKTYLPPGPDLENTLYADRSQLQQTCKYYTMANRRRTQVSIWRDGSAK